MNHKALLVGLGMQGKAALHDLLACGLFSQVTVVDNRAGAEGFLSRYPHERVSYRHLDARDEPALAQLMRGADVVIEALPAPLARPLGRLAADCGVHLVSSMYYDDPGEQDPQRKEAIGREMAEIDRKARSRGVVILTEFGLDPGLDLIMAAKAVGEMEEVLEFYSYGAGIPGPNARANPLHYKFSWSPIGVMRSYRRPARIILDGRPVDIDATSLFESSNCHLLEVPEIGVSLECFPNGDCTHYAHLLGIAASVKTMGRYTCRLPGHCAFWDIMVKCGFLDEQPLAVGNSHVSPVQFTASLLASREQFQYGGGEQDMTFVRVDARGMSGGEPKRAVYQLIDMRDLSTGFTSMQRTVGYTMGLGARLILQGKLRKTGLLSALDVPYEMVMPALEKHGIRIARCALPAAG